MTNDRNSSGSGDNNNNRTALALRNKMMQYPQQLHQHHQLPQRLGGPRQLLAAAARNSQSNNPLQNAVGTWIQKRSSSIRRRPSRHTAALVDRNDSAAAGTITATISFDYDEEEDETTTESSKRTGLLLSEDESESSASRTTTTTTTTYNMRLTPNKNAESRLTASQLHHTERIALRPCDPEDVESFSDAVLVWWQAAQQLLQSPEMGRVVHASVVVAQQTGGLVYQTATFPLRLSWNCTSHVLGRSKQLVVSTTTNLLCLGSRQSTGEGSEEHEEQHGLLHNVIFLPITILGLAGSIMVSVVAPVLQSGDRGETRMLEQAYDCRYTSPSKSPQVKLDPTIPVTESPSYKGDDDSFLERLRLDFVPEDCYDPTTIKAFKKELFPVETSRFLLRVNDLGLTTESGKLIHYIDLTAKDMDEALITKAFERLCSVAFCMIANHFLVRINDPAVETTSQTEIHWHTEGSTKKILRKMSEQNETGRVQTLFSETCIWSGRYNDQSGGYGRGFAFFLARGAVCMDPRQLLCLLWDNNRTGEYNHFCLGRSTLQIVQGSDEAVLNGEDENVFAAKIIRSTMRVPFAGITVKATCLMHVRSLPEGGYVILSRTLDSGTSGTHFSERSVDESSKKNEILWGVNIIRPVQPGVSDLTSLSQVGSSVPNFLAQKIGMMGITDFFKNVRAIAGSSRQE